MFGRAWPAGDEKPAHFCTTSWLGRDRRFPGGAIVDKTPGSGCPYRSCLSQGGILIHRISPKPGPCVKMGTICCSRSRYSPKPGRCAGRKTAVPVREAPPLPNSDVAQGGQPCPPKLPWFRYSQLDACNLSQAETLRRKSSAVLDCSPKVGRCAGTGSRYILRRAVFFQAETLRAQGGVRLKHLIRLRRSAAQTAGEVRLGRAGTASLRREPLPFLTFVNVTSALRRGYA